MSHINRLLGLLHVHRLHSRPSLQHRSPRPVRRQGGIYKPGLKLKLLNMKGMVQLTCTLSLQLFSPQCSWNQETSSARVICFRASICTDRKQVQLKLHVLTASFKEAEKKWWVVFVSTKHLFRRKHQIRSLLTLFISLLKKSLQIQIWSSNK